MVELKKANGFEFEDKGRHYEVGQIDRPKNGKPYGFFHGAIIPYAANHKDCEFCLVAVFASNRGDGYVARIVEDVTPFESRIKAEIERRDIEEKAREEYWEKECARLAKEAEERRVAEEKLISEAASRVGTTVTITSGAYRSINYCDGYSEKVYTFGRAMHEDTFKLFLSFAGKPLKVQEYMFDEFERIMPHDVVTNVFVVRRIKPYDD